MSNNFSNQQFQELLQVKIMSYFCPQRMIYMSGVVMNLDNLELDQIHINFSFQLESIYLLAKYLRYTQVVLVVG